MRTAVLGAGHMGSWLANRLSSDHETAVYDTDEARMAGLKDLIQLADYSALEGFRPELLINAVSLQNTIQAFESCLPYIPEGCIISDVASVKGDIPDFYRKNPLRFASVHPMFGPTFANVDRLSDENVIIIKESDGRGKQFFKDLFGGLGLNQFEYSFDEHDRMIAYSLTLPFASTMVFGACMDNTAVPGTTFKKHLEIAKGLLAEDDYLLSEILFNKYSLPELEKVTGRLDFLKHVIRARDTEEAVKFFDRLRNNLK